MKLHASSVFRVFAMVAVSSLQHFFIAADSESSPSPSPSLLPSSSPSLPSPSPLPLSSSSSLPPCYFAFGDSMSDNGNNNDIKGTAAKANYEPYGIDFPDHPPPTGRFTNGRNLVDFIAEFLGFENYIPSFRTAKDNDILKGVNYASGAAGIRDESGQTQGGRISFNKQLKNHQRTIDEISKTLGDKRTLEHLQSCLYTIDIGSNDYLNNYFMPKSYDTSKRFTPEQYAMVLLNQYTQQLKGLYNQGARKVAVFGVGLIGCTPYARANFPITNGSPCVDNFNSAIQAFNIPLKSRIQELNANLTNAKFTFIDVVAISLSLRGQSHSLDPCCEVAAGQLQCVANGKVCDNRQEYTFWDAVHPTEVAYKVTARRAFNALQPNDTIPYDINHLARLG